MPVVALIVYPNFSPFHFAVPYLVFNMELQERRLFDLKIVALGGQPLAAERALTVRPDGGLELTETADILIVPGWDDLNTPPEPDLVDALAHAHVTAGWILPNSSV
jgi:transcriptional regulator GlxA family with amidase domain